MNKICPNSTCGFNPRTTQLFLWKKKVYIHDLSHECKKKTHWSKSPQNGSTVVKTTSILNAKLRNIFCYRINFSPSSDRVGFHLRLKTLADTCVSRRAFLLLNFAFSTSSRSWVSCKVKIHSSYWFVWPWIHTLTTAHISLSACTFYWPAISAGWD